MLASTQARERLLENNRKKEAQIKELKSFIQRFSANASKAKQATSRANQISKIQLDDIGKSSRVYPFIRFKQEKKLYNNILDVENLSKNYDDLTAVELLQLGKSVWEDVNRENLIRAVENLNKCISMNTDYSTAYADLADV